MTHPDAKLVEEYLRSLRMGKPQVLENLVLFPLRSWLAGSLPYLSLAEATAAGLLQAAEVGTTGGLPDLEVRNTADRPVLLLSGEELASSGTKRVLTTTILLEEAAETTIPASCFDPNRSSHSVDAILEPIRQTEISRREHCSSWPSRFMKLLPDRSAIWSKIDLLRDAPVPRRGSEEVADPAETWKQMLSHAKEVFRRASGQKGMLFLVNGEPIGFDVVSEESCFARQHARLVKDYITKGILEDSEGPADAENAAEIAKGFLDEAIGCRGETHEAIASGNEYLFRGPSMTGSALLHQGRVIHIAFHRLGVSLASPRRRYAGGPIGIVEPR